VRGNLLTQTNDRRARAAHKQLRLGCLVRAASAGFARLSGWQSVGNWVVSAREFSSIAGTRGRHPDNEQKNRDANLPRKFYGVDVGRLPLS
jgi:hypothetical protein